MREAVEGRVAGGWDMGRGAMPRGRGIGGKVGRGLTVAGSASGEGKTNVDIEQREVNFQISN